MTTSFIEYDAAGLDILTSNNDAPIRPLTENSAILSTKVKMPQMVFVHAAALENVDLVNPGIGFDDVNFISGNLYACHLQSITTESMIYRFDGTSLVPDEFSQYLVESGLLLGFQVQLGTFNKKKIFKNVSGLNPVFGINDILFENADSGATAIPDYQGIIDSTSTLATFANPSVGWFWQVVESFALDGFHTRVGDIIKCTTPFVGTPTNLYDNFNRYYVLNRGTIKSTNVLSDFGNSVSGMFWTANEQFTLGGVNFEIGDIIECTTPFVGTPLNLTTNFKISKIPIANFGTGVISGCALSINALDATKVDIGTGMYSITDVYTDVGNQITTKIEITAPITVTLTHLADQIVTYLSLDGNKNVIQSASFPNAISRRDYAFIGVAVHSSNTVVNAVNNLPIVAIDANAQIQDILNYIGFKSLTGNLLSTNGANLLLNKSAGTAFKAGANFSVNRKQPHEFLLAEQLGFTFRYRNQNGLEGTDVTAFDPTHYDLNGVTTVVPGGNDATIQRIYIFSSGLIRVQRGQAVYANMDEAISAYASDSFVTETNIAQNGLYLGALIVRKDCTSFLDTARCRIVNGSGNVSGGAANLTNNLVGGLLGSIPYQSAPNVTALLTGNITIGKLFLSQTGTGSASAAPVWSQITYNDLNGTLPTGLSLNASAVTYTLTSTSNPIQRTTGNGVTIYILPDATTLKMNQMFTFSQDSGDSRIQIKNAGSVIIAYVTQGMQLTATCTSTSTANGTWYFTKMSRGYINPLGYGIDNVALGSATGPLLLDGTQNTVIGNGAGFSLVSGSANTLIGFNSGLASTGAGNTFLGNASGSAITSGSFNTYIGGYIGTGREAESNNVILSDGAGNIVARFSGTIQNANYVLASPNGSSGPAVMRALVPNDVAGATTGFASQSTDVILTSISPKTQVVIGAVNVPSFTLPDATTLALNRTFTLINQSTAIGGNNGIGLIKNNAGTTLFNIPIGGTIDAICIDTSTTDGTWSFLLTYGSSLSPLATQLGNFTLGSQGGSAITTGTQNTFIGTRAGKSAFGASSYNTLVGYQAGSAITTGSNNTALGLGALSGIITGSNATAIGYAALNIASGIGNTAIGANAGSAITTGSNNTYIGGYTGNNGNDPSTTGQVVLSNGIGFILFRASQTQPAAQNLQISLANLTVFGCKIPTGLYYYSSLAGFVNLSMTFTVPDIKYVIIDTKTTQNSACGICSYVIGTDTYVSVAHGGTNSFSTYKWNGTSFNNPISTGVNGSQQDSINTYIIGADTYISLTNNASNNVSTYKWNGTSFTSIGAAVATGTGPRGITSYMIGTDTYISVANYTANVFSTFKWNGTTWVSIGADVATGTSPIDITSYTIGSDSFISLVNSVSNTFSTYKWNGAAFISIGTAVATGTSPRGITSYAIGADAYISVVNYTANTLSTFKWNGTAFISIGTAIATGSSPIDITSYTIGSDSFISTANYQNSVSTFIWNGTTFIPYGATVAGAGNVQPQSLVSYIIGDERYISTACANGNLMVTYSFNSTAIANYPLKISRIVRTANINSSSLLKVLCLDSSAQLIGKTEPGTNDITLYDLSTGVIAKGNYLSGKTIFIDGTYTTD